MDELVEVRRREKRKNKRAKETDQTEKSVLHFLFPMILGSVNFCVTCQTQVFFNILPVYLFSSSSRPSQAL
uniref:Uncharacterized protein n=1 Tax=Caenorhabditis tropicalis TaxID=1561998 RepID=A0A1I7UYE0_9PELO